MPIEQSGKDEDSSAAAAAPVAPVQAAPLTEAKWLPTAGVDRDRMPGIHLAWLVGWKEHSDAIWHREGMAVLSLHNQGPYGYSAETMAAAMRLLDMDGVDCVPLYRRLPKGPLPSLVLDATAAITRATEA